MQRKVREIMAGKPALVTPFISQYIVAGPSLKFSIQCVNIFPFYLLNPLGIKLSRSSRGW